MGKQDINVILSDKEVINKVRYKHNIFCKEYDNSITTNKDYKIINTKLNQEFSNRRYHIDNGVSVEKSGIESIYIVECEKDKIQYAVTKTAWLNYNSYDIYNTTVKVDFLG